MAERVFGSLLLVGALLGLGWTSVPLQATAAAPQSKTETAVFKVSGMTCGGCEVGVRMAVGKLDGVEKVEASYEKGSATVRYDPSKVTPKAIAAAIEKLGYEAELKESVIK